MSQPDFDKEILGLEATLEGETAVNEDLKARVAAQEPSPFVTKFIDVMGNVLLVSAGLVALGAVVGLGFAIIKGILWVAGL